MWLENKGTMSSAEWTSGSCHKGKLDGGRELKLIRPVLGNVNFRRKSYCKQMISWEETLNF
jgi:hypothetical protein